MKHQKNVAFFSILFCFILFILTSFVVEDKSEQNNFYTFFESKTLRIDFLLIGNDTSEEFILKSLKKQPIWAGTERLANNCDKDFGNYRLMVFDSASQLLLYKQGFSSLFNEWQTTPESKKNKESFYHVNLIPFPKKTIRYVLEKRTFADNHFYPIKEIYINPGNYFIYDEKPVETPYKVIEGGTDFPHKIDIAFVAEGYTNNEMKKFEADVKKVWEYFCTVPPFDINRQKFNIYAVKSVSEETGTDIQGENIYKNTVLNSGFYTFNIPRYLTTNDLKTLHDVLGNVPCDQIFILINSEEYGGGGFYNYYSTSTIDHPLSLKVAIHEFGHGFAGLADEYYESGVSYNAFYNLETEPWEPNITTLVAFETKWKEMMSSAMNIPTERVYEFKDSIGVYEGGGYVSKGIYSPFQDCRMKSNGSKGFCPVCLRAINQMIDLYTK